MGTFQGHALPGGFFLMFGVWWTYQMVCKLTSKFMVTTGGRRTSHQEKVGHGSFVIYPRKVKSENSHPSGVCQMLEVIPKEAILKLISACVGLGAELYYAFPHGKFQFVGDLQHATMYLAFALTGLADILRFYRLVTAVPLDYLATLAALTCEAILFAYHITYLDGLPLFVHQLLIVTIVGAALATGLEMLSASAEEAVSGCQMKMVVFQYVRIYFILLQGSWFMQIAFLLYNPLPSDGMSDITASSHQHQWMPPDMDHIGTWCSLFYVWHCIGVAVGMLALSALTYYLTACCFFRNLPISSVESYQDDEQGGDMQPKYGNMFRYERIDRVAERECTG